MKKLLLPALSVALLFSLNSCKSGSSDTGKEDPEITTVYAQGDSSGADAKFVDKVLVMGMFIGKASDYARINASRPEVRAFAQQLMDEHFRTDDSLARMATEKGLVVPGGLPETDMNAMRTMMDTKGAALDTAYLGRMVFFLKNSLETVRATAQKSTDEKLKAWAKAKEQTLKMRLDKTEQMLDDLN